MTLSAVGNLSLTCQETDWSNMDDVEAEFESAFAGFSEAFEQQINAQIEAQVESQLEVLDEQMDTLAASLEGSGLSDAVRRLAWLMTGPTTARLTAMTLR